MGVRGPQRVHDGISGVWEALFKTFPSSTPDPWAPIFAPFRQTLLAIRWLRCMTCLNCFAYQKFYIFFFAQHTRYAEKPDTQKAACSCDGDLAARANC